MNQELIVKPGHLATPEDGRLTPHSAPIEDGDVNASNVAKVQDPHTSGFVIALTLLATTGSFLFGYDTGIVSAAILFLREEFALTPVWQEAIISITVGAAAVFALVGGFVNEVFGRKPSMIFASVVFTIGSILLGLSYNKIMLLLGRLIVGIGIGLSSMTVPMYIAECAPVRIRGRLVTIHQLMITIGMLSANLLGGVFSYVTNGWRYMLAIAAGPAVIQLFGFMFMPESPRWLIRKGHLERARVVLRMIHCTEDADAEVESIRKSIISAERKTKTVKGCFVFRRMLTTPTVRKALLVGCGLQLFQQLAGINTVMYYTATIIKMAGIRENSVAIWLSALVAGSNVLFTIVGLYLVDKLGRRTLILASYIGVTFALAILAVGFEISAVNSPNVQVVEDGLSPICSAFNMCESCIHERRCGFCFQQYGNEPVNGSCLPTDNEYSSQSTGGRCNNTSRDTLYIWAYEYCPTPYSWIPIVGMIIYLVFFAPGFAPMPWTINSEIYPLWARSAGNALAAATNWTTNLIVSMTFLTLAQAISKHGTYWMYAGIAVFGILFIFLFLPETKDKSLEEVEELFARPWTDNLGASCHTFLKRNITSGAARTINTNNSIYRG